MENIEIYPANENDKNDIFRIAEESFGKGYFDDITDFLNDENHFIYVAKIENKIVGFVAGYLLLNKNEIKNLFKNKKEFKNYSNIINLNLGVIKTISVDQNFQKKGIGKKLFSQAETFLINTLSHHIVVPAWSYTDQFNTSKLNIRGLLKNFNYEFLFVDEKYWESECLNNEFCCEIKKENTCICKNEFYIKKL